MSKSFGKNYHSLFLFLFLSITLVLVTGCDSSPPSSDPPPNGEQWFPQEVIDDPRLGFAWASNFYAGGPDYTVVQKAKDIGAMWDRWPFERPRVDVEGSFVFTLPHPQNINYEGAVQGDEAAGLKILGVINGGATFDNDGNVDLQYWRDYVDAIVSEYKGSIDAWEIGNEVGLPHQPELSPSDYIDILHVTCEVLYNHYSEAEEREELMVLLGSPEQRYWQGDSSSMSYWQNVLDAIKNDLDNVSRNYGKLSTCLDAVGVHVYGRPTDSRDYIETAYNKAKGGLASWNPGVWVTEHGVMWRKVDEAPKLTYANKYRQASYVVQQYVLALVGFENVGISTEPADSDRAKLFYHRLADAGAGAEDPEVPWGTMTPDGNTIYPSYTAMALATSLFSEFSAPEIVIDNAEYSHYRFEKDGGYTHVLWSKTKNSVPAVAVEAGGSGQCATLYYQPGDGDYPENEDPTTPEKDGSFWVQSSFPAATSGVFLIDLPGTTEIRTTVQGIADSLARGPMIGGPVFILVETNDPCTASSSPPSGSASLICRNGQVVGTELTGYDEFSGLASLTQVCSPAKTYNLSWTQPGRTYAGTVRMVPPEGGTCTLTLTNKAGVSMQQTLSNPPDACQGGGGGGGTDPGGDHPDDNAAATGGLVQDTFFAVPEGARHPAQVALLNRGFAHDLWQWLLDIGEPADLIGHDFAPESTVAQYPVLLIPSGGLFGLETDTEFRARLEEYTRLGGTLISFAQQHGYEFRALPGGEVDGYGWDEDISCFKAALTMETWHPALAGFNRDKLTVHVDGYFSRWPENAAILLSRTANGQPAVLSYTYPPPDSGGAGGGPGRVIATTLYDDWGTGFGQSAADARTLLRDLLTWSLPPADLSPIASEETLVLSLPVTNTTSVESNGVLFRLVDPTRQVVLTQTVALTLTAGSTVAVPFTVTTAEPYGLWRVDAQLLTLHHYPLTPFQQVGRFAVSQPPALVAPTSPVYLNITAPSSTFAAGSVVPFVYHINNTSNATFTGTLAYGYDHMAMHKYKPLSTNLTLLPGITRITQTHKITRTVRLRGHLESSVGQAVASYGIIKVRPELSIYPGLNQTTAQRGETGGRQSFAERERREGVQLGDRFQG